MKKNNIFLAIGITGLIAIFAIGMLSINNQTVSFQKNMIGKLYQEENISAKQYIYAIFEDVEQENITVAEEVLFEYGFTEKGAFYMERAMGLMEKHILLCCMELMFLALLLYGVYQSKKEWRKEQELLLAQIEELEGARLQEDYQERQNKRIQNFIENVAHQIKTPISRVTSSLYMIEENVGNTDAKNRIDECYSHLENVNSLMKRLMDIGRLEAGKILFKKEKVYLKELFYDVAKSSGASWEKINIILGSSEEMVYYGDYEWLKEAFLNIVKNGLEHDTSDKPLEIICLKNEDGFKISIRDHGEGLSERDIPNLFDRFYMPEKKKENHTGIGLNLSKLIFEGHFGTVYVYNHVEGGAVFNVLLPMYTLKPGNASYER